MQEVALTLLAAVVGSCVTFFLTYLQELWQKRRKRQNPSAKKRRQRHR